MKLSKTFRLSEEAAQVLDQQTNATQYVEDLILQNKQPISRGEALILDELQKLTSGSTATTDSDSRPSQASTPNKQPAALKPTTSVYKQHSVTTPQPFDAAANGRFLQPCCKLPTPCKHWVWDENGGEGYINTITGEVREA